MLREMVRQQDEKEEKRFKVVVSKMGEKTDCHIDKHCFKPYSGR